MYPELPKTRDELKKLAEGVVARRSTSYVNDAYVLARVVLEDLLPRLVQLETSLGATREASERLFEENERLKREVPTSPDLREIAGKDVSRDTPDSEPSGR